MSQSLRGVNKYSVAALLLACAFFLAGLNRLPVPTVDGAVRASMARNIVETGQLWPITYDGMVFTDHPPLFLWFTALSYKIFGVNDFAANFVPRLFAALTVLVTFFIAVEAGFTLGVGLAAAFVLCLTRDFILSSVRGYIEPVLEFYIYFGVWAALCFRNRKALKWAALSGVSIWLATYSKGPVALWPFLFCIGVLGSTRRVASIGVYLLAFALCTGIWATWVTVREDWPHWHSYLFGQVFSSALEGRGGAQGFEPLYFVRILAKFYWPWLPLFIVALIKAVRSRQPMLLAFALLGFGFLGGFSLMKWKFWYYIAPAYPAFALLIAAAFAEAYRKQASSAIFPQTVTILSLAWILIASVFPVRLHHERVPEVMAFKETISGSNTIGPVWFVKSTRDHNMIGTSGEWYFRRSVAKVTDEELESWQKTKLKAPAWIITGIDQLNTCNTQQWCRGSEFIQRSGASALLYYSGHHLAQAAAD